MDAVTVERPITTPLRTTHRAALVPVGAGILAAGALVGLYLGIISVAQDWQHATSQLASDRWWVGAIVIGFGVQVGLFVHLRRLHSRATAGGMAMSTGTSTAAMLACCAHHLSDVLPIIGISGAAVFLNQYKTSFLALGVAMNVLGVLYLLRKIRQMRHMHGPVAAVAHPSHEEH